MNFYPYVSTSFFTFPIFFILFTTSIIVSSGVDAPAEIPTDILEYNLQLNSKINRHNNNILLAIAEPNESGIDTDTHGSDSYEQHADEDDYKADTPAETGTTDIIGEYQV